MCQHSVFCVQSELNDAFLGCSKLCVLNIFLNQYLYRETKSQTVSTLAQGLQTKRGGITISEQVFQLSGEGPLNLIKLAFLAGLNQKKI